MSYCVSMSRERYRLGLWSLLFLTCAVLLASLYFEYIQGLNPCPLCLMQRLCVVLLLLLVILVLYFKESVLSKKMVLIQMLVSAGGIFFALRQVWMQSLPADQVPICVPGLRMMLHYLPWRDVLHVLLFGAGDCAELAWSWLGLSMAAWSALYFIGMLFASLLSYTYLRQYLSTHKASRLL